MLNGSDEEADIDSRKAIRRASVASQFKARVALDALKGIRMIIEITRENEVAPSQVGAWKKELESRIDEILEGKSEVARELARKLLKRFFQVCSACDHAALIRCLNDFENNTALRSA